VGKLSTDAHPTAPFKAYGDLQMHVQDGKRYGTGKVSDALLAIKRPFDRRSRSVTFPVPEISPVSRISNRNRFYITVKSLLTWRV
jgi:hypothetical protein